LTKEEKPATRISIENEIRAAVAAGDMREAHARLVLKLYVQQSTDVGNVVRHKGHLHPRASAVSFERHREQIGLAMAIEEQEDQRQHEAGSPVLDEVTRNETVARVRSRFSSSTVKCVLAKLESGEWSVDQARDYLAKHRER
jgi:hypothetical protein